MIRIFFTITIPVGQQLDEIVLEDYVASNAEGSFLAVESGPQISDPTSDAALLGGTLIGSGELGFDVLPNVAAGDYGAGFSAPLPAGGYTFWFQETGGSVDYTFSFKTSSVPEPAAVFLLVVGALASCQSVRQKRGCDRR